MIDRIRMLVGAEHLVSEQTKKEIAAEEKAGRGLASIIKPGQKISGTKEEKKRQLVRSIARYCNEDYNAKVCKHYLTQCGESCRTLVRKEVWNKLMSKKKTSAERVAAATQKSAKSRRR